jgi:hypothetical protein
VNFKEKKELRLCLDDDGKKLRKNYKKIFKNNNNKNLKKKLGENTFYPPEVSTNLQFYL